MNRADPCTRVPIRYRRDCPVSRPISGVWVSLLEHVPVVKPGELASEPLSRDQVGPSTEACSQIERGEVIRRWLMAQWAVRRFQWAW